MDPFWVMVCFSSVGVFTYPYRPFHYFLFECNNNRQTTGNGAYLAIWSNLIKKTIDQVKNSENSNFS